MSGKRRKKPFNKVQVIQRQSDSEHEPGLVTTMRAHYSGPLPPPSLLAQYNDAVPSGAERILAMAERQSAHREAIEAQVIAGNLAAQLRGTVFGFLLALVTIVGGIYVIAIGKNLAGLVMIITAVASLASVFVVSKSTQKKERAEKSATLESRRSQQ